MKRILLFLAFEFLLFISSNAQNVGIGTTAPVAMLHVKDSNVLFSGPATIPSSTLFNPPIQGAGVRMMWYPQKAAFRVGGVEGDQSTFWNKDSIGRMSFASGYGTKAKGAGSIAMGWQSNATGDYSVSLGGVNTASGVLSVAIGSFITASGGYATALGVENVASGDHSTATGRLTTASNFSAMSINEKTTAAGAFSLAGGLLSKTKGDASVALGYSVYAKAQGGFALGSFNDSTDNPHPITPEQTDRIFQIGNGSTDSTRSNALTVLRNGNAGIGTTTPLARLHVADSNVVFTGSSTIPANTTFPPPVGGPGSRMMWYPQKAAFRVGLVEGPQSTYWDKDSIGRLSFAAGYGTKAKGYASVSTGGNTTALGDYSTAMGLATTASGGASTAMGNQTTASGDVSTAMGNYTTASGNSSTAMGLATTASGWNSTAMGESTTASGNNSTAMGNYSTASGWNSTAMGLGTTASADRSTAMGDYTSASGEHSTAMGRLTAASNFSAMAINEKTTATGAFSLAGGLLSKTKGDASIALGYSVYANAPGGFATGAFNDSTDNPHPITPAPTDRIFQIGNGSADSTRRNAVTVLRNGKMGIGTTTPAARLHLIDSSVLFTGPTVLPASPGNPPAIGGGYRMMWYADKAAFRAGQAIGDSWDKDNIGNMSFATGSATRATGTTSFAAGNFSYAIGDASAAAGFSVQAKAFGGVCFGIYNDITDNPNPATATAADRIFQVGNGNSNITRTNALTILRNGNVGIGTTVPNAQLQLGNTTGNKKLVLYDNLLNDNQFFGFGVNSGELRYQVNTTSDNHRFYAGVNPTTSNLLFTIQGNGNATLAGTLTQNSDARLKTNIHRIGNPLQNLQQLNGYTYNWLSKDRDPGMQTGLLAQEVQKVYPQLVKEDEKGVLSVNYSGLIPVLLEAIKEQQKQIEELKQIIKSYKN